MPTYEYQCVKCKVSYELRQGFDAETTHPCEECGKGVAKRILHAPRVVFKGSGWYATDSRKSQSAVSESADGSGGTASDSSEAGDAPAKESSESSTPKEPKPKQAAAAKSTSSKDSGTPSSESAAAG